MLFREQSRKNEHFSKEVFAKELKKLVSLEETRPRNERCWRFPPLDECRNDIEEKYGIKITEPGYPGEPGSALLSLNLRPPVY